MVSYPPEFCPYCGTALAPVEVEGEEHGHCPDCDRVVWHNPVPGASVSVVDREEGTGSEASGPGPRGSAAVLLVERAVPPGVGEWTIPGGHLKRDEAPAVGAARELEEETGLSVDPADLRLYDAASLGGFGGKYVVSVGYVVDRAATSGTLQAGSDAADARFFTPSALDRADAPLREYFRERFETAPDAV